MEEIRLVISEIDTTELTPSNSLIKQDRQIKS